MGEVWASIEAEHGLGSGGPGGGASGSGPHGPEPLTAKQEAAKAAERRRIA
jgi:hypothetical protein